MDEFLESDSPLNAELECACNDPEACDVSFSAQREASGFANFGFDPDEATRLREVELARIAAEFENETPEYSDDDEDDELFDAWDSSEDEDEDDLFSDDEEWEDEDLDDLDDDEDEYDRHAESYGRDLEDDWRDDWEDE